MEQPTEAQIYTELETRIDLRGKKIETLSNQMKDLSNSVKAMKEQLNNFPKLVEKMMQRCEKSLRERHQPEDGESKVELHHPATADADCYSPFFNRYHSDESLFTLPEVKLAVSEEYEALPALIPNQTKELSRFLTDLKEKIAKLSDQFNKNKIGNPRASLSVSQGEEHHDVGTITLGSDCRVFECLKGMEDEGTTVEVVEKPNAISVMMNSRDEEIKVSNQVWSIHGDTSMFYYPKKSTQQEGLIGLAPNKTSDLQVVAKSVAPRNAFSCLSEIISQEQSQHKNMVIDDTGEPPTIIFSSEALSIKTIYTPVEIAFYRALTAQPSWFFSSPFVSLIHRAHKLYNQKKHNTSYYNWVNTRDIKMELQLPLEKLRRMEMFLVSDYIEHDNGIGSVDVIEVMNVFPEEDNLHKLRKWLETQDPSILQNVGGKEGSSTRVKQSNSSSEEASTVDQDVLKLDLFVLCKLCLEKIGWGTKKVYELLHPVSKKYNKHEIQLLLETFYIFNERFAKFHSKRITKSMTGTTGSKASKLIDDNEDNVSNDEKRKKVKHEEGMDNITAKKQHKSRGRGRGRGQFKKKKENNLELFGTCSDNGNNCSYLEEPDSEHLKREHEIRRSKRVRESVILVPTSNQNSAINDPNVEPLKGGKTLVNTEATGVVDRSRTHSYEVEMDAVFCQNDKNTLEAEQMKQWLIPWQQSPIEETTWEIALQTKSQSPKSRLEDKPLLQDGGIDRESAIFKIYRQT